MNKNVYCLNLKEKFLFFDVDTMEKIEIGRSELTRTKLLDIMGHFEMKYNYIERFSAVPHDMLINPTIVTGFDCNYRCNYCFEKNIGLKREKMQLEDIGLIKKFYEVYCSHYKHPINYGVVRVIGGEPLLLKNMKLLERIFEEWEDQEVEITTNGTYILDYIELFKRNNVKFKVSIDGTERVHLKNRICTQKDAYRNAVLGIKELLENKKRVLIITVFSPENVLDYPRFFDMLENLGWLKDKNLSLAFIPKRNYGCDDIDRRYLLESLEGLNRLMKIDSRTRFVNKHKMVPGAIELEQGLILSNNKEFEPYRCANLYNPNFCFLPEGDVSICMGAINKNGTIGRYKPEVEIDYKKLDIIKARRIDRNEKCQVCSYKVFCRGGCLATALSRTSNCLEHVCDLWNTPDFIKYLELAF